MQTGGNHLRALYYPYSQCLNSDFLRRAILVFDQLVFLGPLGDTPPLVGWEAYDQALGRHGEHLLYAWDQLQPEYELLLSRNVIGFVDTKNLDSDLVIAAWLDDLSDPELSTISGGNSSLGWLVPRARIPRGSELWAAIANAKKTTKTIRDNELIGYVLNYFHTDGDNWWSRSHRGIELDRLPLGIASCLYINQCLLAAEQGGLIPVTDSIIHHTMLLRKYERAQANAGSLESRQPPASFGLEQTGGEIQKHFILTISLLNTFLTEQELQKRSFSELLAYRDACGEQLGRFRLYVNKMATSLQAEPWTPEFQVQLNKVIQSEVIPEVQRARDGMKGVYEGLFGGIAKAVLPHSLGALTPALIASFMAHLSLHQIVALGATALVSGVGLAIPQVVDSWKETKTQRRNSLSLLSEISDSAGLEVRVRTKRLLLFADESVLHRQPPPDILFRQPDRLRADPEVRQQVMRYLLATMVSAGDAETRRDAASFFEYLADGDDKNLNGRCEWLKDLSTMEIDEHTLDALIGLLAVDHFQGVVTMMFGLWKPPRATSALIEHLSQGKGGGFGWALTALIRIGGPVVERFLASLASESGEDWQRSEAIDGLAILKVKSAIPVLLSIAEDHKEDNYLRGHAALAAALLGEERGNELMLACGYKWTLKDRPDYQPGLPEQRCLSRLGIAT